MNKYKVILSPTFRKMFKEHLNKYKYYSDVYCNNIEKKLYNAINLLKLFPYSLPIIKYKGIPQIYRKYIIKNRFLIIFKIVNNNVYLLYFIDGRQNPKKYFNLLKK